MSDKELANIPIEMRTPITEAGAILCELAEIHQNITKADDFIEKYFGEMWKDKTTNGDELSLQFYQIMNETPDEIKKFAGFLSLVISCAYCVQAMNEYIVNKQKPTNRAWAYICEANHWLNIIKGIIINNEEKGKTLSDNASKAASARYAKDKKQQQLKEIKEEFHKNKHKFTIRGQTAEFVREMAKKYIDTQDADTIAKHVADWKKE